MPCLRKNALKQGRAFAAYLALIRVVSASLWLAGNNAPLQMAQPAGIGKADAIRSVDFVGLRFVLIVVKPNRPALAALPETKSLL